jgi:hypothetical protein
MKLENTVIVRDPRRSKNAEDVVNTREQLQLQVTHVEEVFRILKTRKYFP